MIIKIILGIAIFEIYFLWVFWLAESKSEVKVQDGKISDFLPQIRILWCENLRELV